MKRYYNKSNGVESFEISTHDGIVFCEHSMGFGILTFCYFLMPTFFLVFGMTVYTILTALLKTGWGSLPFYFLLTTGGILLLLLSRAFLFMKYQYLFGMPYIRFKKDRCYFGQTASFGEKSILHIENIKRFYVEPMKIGFWHYQVLFAASKKGNIRLPFSGLDSELLEGFVSELNLRLNDMKQGKADRDEPYVWNDVDDICIEERLLSVKDKIVELMLMIFVFGLMNTFFVIILNAMSADMFMRVLSSFIFIIFSIFTILLFKNWIIFFCSRQYKFKKDEIIVSQYGMMKQIFKLEQLALCELKEGNSDHSELKIMDEEGRMLIVKGSSEEIQMVNKFLEGQLQSIKPK